MFSRSLRAITVPLVLSVWQTAVVAQTQAPVPAADSTRSSTAVPATPQTPGLDTTVSPLPASVVPPLPKPQGNGALFGASDTINAARPLAIDATVSVSAAYDDDLSEGQSASLTPVGGEYSDVTPALSLSRNRQHSQFTARATTSLRHYPSLNRFVGSSYSGASNMRIDLSSRTTVQASADGTFLSEFAFDTVARQPGLGNVALSSAGLDIAALDRARISYGATAGITHKVGLHTTLALTAGARDSERPIVNELAGEQSVGSFVSRAVGRDTSIRFSYTVRRYTEQFGGEAQPAWSNDFELGFGHRWRHSRDRRTALDLSFGPSLLRAPSTLVRQTSTLLVPQTSTLLVPQTSTLLVPQTGSAVPLLQQAVPTGPASTTSQFNVVGSAALSHDMSRSWNLSTTFRRGAGSIDGLVSDSATFDLRGLLNRRMELIESAGLFQTELGAGAAQNRYNTRYASSRVQVALTRAIAIYGQYVLYYFDYGSGGLLAPGVSPQQIRRGARAGITLWTPLHEGR